MAGLVDDSAPMVEPATGDTVVVSTKRVAVLGECDSDLGFEIGSDGNLDRDQAGI